MYAVKKPFPVNISGDITVPDKCKDTVFRNSNLPSTFFKEKYFICPGSGEIVEAEAARSKSALGGAMTSTASRTLAPGLASRTPSPTLSKTLPGIKKDAGSPGVDDG